MTTREPKGGPAFPRTGTLESPSSEWIDPQDGMFLRDWFAGRAMQAGLSGVLPEHWDELSGKDVADRIAKLAYKMADAMLEAREHQETVSRETQCDLCHGSGKCYKCNGVLLHVCKICFDDGQCRQCKGTGRLYAETPNG